MPLLTVLMSTYNETFKELNESIDSILDQTFTDFRFIIIDDNPKSTKLKKYLCRKRLRDKRISLIFNKHNLGLVKSLNKGLRITKTYLIARMDADDISNKNRFNSQIKFMKKYNLDFVFPNNCTIFHNKIDKSNISFKQKIINQRSLKYFFAHYYNFSMHSGWMLKRQIYEKLCGYRNILYIEDFDFIFRSLVYNYKLGYQPNILMAYRVRDTGLSRSHTLSQFLSTLILQKYVRKVSYKKIMPRNYINNKITHYINGKSIKHFNRFLSSKSLFKRKKNIINFIRAIISMLKSSNALRLMFSTKILIPLANKGISVYLKIHNL